MLSWFLMGGGTRDSSLVALAAYARTIIQAIIRESTY